jgi:hypothetical protein
MNRRYEPLEEFEPNIRDTVWEFIQGAWGIVVMVIAALYFILRPLVAYWFGV